MYKGKLDNPESVADVPYVGVGQILSSQKVIHQALIAE